MSEGCNRAAKIHASVHREDPLFLEAGTEMKIKHCFFLSRQRTWTVPTNDNRVITLTARDLPGRQPAGKAKRAGSRAV